MSALQRHILRPQLSARYVTLLRQTSARHASSSTAPLPPSPPRSSPPPGRYRRAIVWSSLALLLGIGTGQFALHTLLPPTTLDPDSSTDAILLTDLEQRLDNEFTVKVLRGKCLGVSKALKGETTGWAEILPAASSPPGPGNGGTLMHALRGSANLGVERTFWSAAERKLVSVVWFGGDVTGWPGVVHGGVLATAVTEKLALANALAQGNTPGDARASPAAVPQRLPSTGSHAVMPLPDVPPREPAQLSVDYVRPTFARNFHVVRVVPAWDAPDALRWPVEGGEWVATVETLEKQKVCVRAEAKFEARSPAERAEGAVVQAAQWSYREFREWLWPSRQRQTLEAVG